MNSQKKTARVEALAVLIYACEKQNDHGQGTHRGHLSNCLDDQQAHSDKENKPPPTGLVRFILMMCFLFINLHSSLKILWLITTLGSLSYLFMTCQGITTFRFGIIGLINWCIYLECHKCSPLDFFQVIPQGSDQ